MKRTLMILAVIGILTSCSSNKDETVKKEVVTTQVTAPQVAPKEKVVVEKTVVVETVVEAEVTAPKVVKPVLKKSDYDKAIKLTRKRQETKVEKPAMVVKTKEIVEEKEVTPVVTTETSIDAVVNSDVDKKIAKEEADTKVVETKPLEEKKSNNVLYGILAAIIVAGGAFFLKKKKG